MRIVCIVLIAVWSMSVGVSSAEDQRENTQCGAPYADAVEPVPAPFDEWVVVLCLPDGQALAAKVEKGEEGTAWRHHRKGSPIMVTAVPLGTKPMPKTKTYDPRRDMRFSEFVGGKLSGPRFDLAKKILARSFDNGDETKVDEIYELDARSEYRGLIYNLFFYLDQGVPRQLVVCLDRCRLSVPVDIKTLSELKAGK